MKSAVCAFVFCAALLGGLPAFAVDKVEVEKLSTPQKQQKEAPITPDQQALLVCQTADIMGAGASAVAGPDYVPGVDAYGNPVAPADGGAASPFTIPDQIEVPVNIDVMQAMGVTMPAGRDMKANFGTLTVFKGGKLLYNGQDISNSVDGYCRTHLPKTEEKK